MIEEEKTTTTTTVNKRKRLDLTTSKKNKKKERKRRMCALPLTPFMVFAGSIRESVLRKNPTGTPVDLGRLLVGEWKKLTAEQRKMYEDISNSDADAYSRREDDNMSERKEQQQQEEKEEEEGKKKKKHMTAYDYYDQVARKRFKQLNPNASVEELKELTMLGWRNLPTSQKHSFEQLARRESLSSSNTQDSSQDTQNQEQKKRKSSAIPIKIPITKKIKIANSKKLNLQPLVVPNSNIKSNKTNIKTPPPFVMSPMGLRSTSPVPGGMMMLSPTSIDPRLMSPPPGTFPHLPFFPPGMTFPPPPQVGNQTSNGVGGVKNGKSTTTPPQTPQEMMAAAAAAAAMISPEFARQMSSTMMGFPVSPTPPPPPSNNNNHKK